MFKYLLAGLMTMTLVSQAHARDTEITNNAKELAILETPCHENGFEGFQSCMHVIRTVSNKEATFDYETLAKYVTLVPNDTQAVLIVSYANVTMAHTIEVNITPPGGLFKVQWNSDEPISHFYVPINGEYDMNFIYNNDNSTFNAFVDIVNPGTE